LVDSAVEVLGEIDRVVDLHLGEFRGECVEQGICLVSFCRIECQ
jgi:hypothetical protein